MRAGKKIFLVLLAASFILSPSSFIYAKTTITLRPDKDRYQADFFTGKYWVKFKYDGKIYRVPGSDYKDYVSICADPMVYANDLNYTNLRNIHTDEDFFCYQYTYDLNRYYEVGFSSESKQQRVICTDLGTGVQVWKKDFPVYFDYGYEDQWTIYTNVFLDGNRLYFQNNSWVIGVDKNTGEKVFESEGGVVALESVHKDNLIVNYCNHIASLSTETGKYKWVANTMFYPVNLVYGDNFVSCLDGIIDTDDGKIVFRIDRRKSKIVAGFGSTFMVATISVDDFWNTNRFDRLDCYTIGNYEPKWSMDKLSFTTFFDSCYCLGSTVFFFVRSTRDVNLSGIYKADLSSSVVEQVLKIEGEKGCGGIGTDVCQNKAFFWLTDSVNNDIVVIDPINKKYQNTLSFKLYSGLMYINRGFYIHIAPSGYLDFDGNGSIKLEL